jgi:hypothetical protein
VDLPAPEHRGDLGIVGGHDEGRCARGIGGESTGEQREHVVPGLRIDRAGRLVGDHEAGTAQHGQCDGGPLRLTARQLGGAAAAKTRIPEAHPGQHLARARAIRAGHDPELTTQSDQRMERLDAALGHEADALEAGGVTASGQGETVQEPPGQNRQQEALASARWPAHDDPFTGGHLQARDFQQRSRLICSADVGVDKCEHGASIAVVGPSRVQPWY